MKPEGLSEPLAGADNTVWYDWNGRQALSLSQGVPFEEWMAHPNHPGTFAWHPEGFPIFLRPTEISQMDEYAEDDPYAVARNLDTPFQRHRVETTLALLRRVAGGSTRILDVACGEGHLTEAMRRAFPEAEFHAFDGSLTAIRSAQGRYAGISFAVASAYDPPYAPESFDCLVCNNIWEHVPDPLHLLDRIGRCLKPGGHLILSTPSRYRLNNLWRVLAGRRVVLGSRHHVTEYSVGQVMEQLRYGNFEVEEVSGKPLRSRGGAIRRAVVWSVAASVQGAVNILRSHHVVGQTAFYLARKSAHAEQMAGGPGEKE